MAEKDLMFSESQIEFILKRAKAAWRHNKQRPSQEDSFLLTLKSYLSCFGTGKNEI